MRKRSQQVAKIELPLQKRSVFFILHQMLDDLPVRILIQNAVFADDDPLLSFSYYYVVLDSKIENMFTEIIPLKEIVQNSTSPLLNVFPG